MEKPKSTNAVCHLVESDSKLWPVISSLGRKLGKSDHVTDLPLYASRLPYPQRVETTASKSLILDLKVAICVESLLEENRQHGFASRAEGMKSAKIDVLC
jgi:hypothetical protein